MSFKADHAVIHEFGTVINGLVDDADAASRYVWQWLEISGAKGSLYQTVFDAVASMKPQLAGNYSWLSAIIYSSAQEVGKAASYYQSTDAAAAERLDNTY